MRPAGAAKRRSVKREANLRLQVEKPLRVAVRNALSIRGADGNVVQKRARFRHRSVRMVGREHDPLDADLQQPISWQRFSTWKPAKV
jgi:hypothetical protein